MSRSRERFLTGQGRYTADLALPGMVHAAFVRSDRAHAIVRGIEADEARAMPGVIAVLTDGDIPAPGGFPAFLRYPDRNGKPFVAPPRTVLARGRVRHVGEVVAIVVAATAAQAQDAAEAVYVEYEDLPAIVGVDRARAPDAPAIHESHAGNLAYAGRFGDGGACRAAESDAAHILERTVELPRVVPNAMEPRSALARWDEAAGAFDLWAPHQGVPEIRRDLSVALDLPLERVRVHPVDVGGGFGARGPAYPEYAALMLAARATGKPVRWTGSRLEGFLGEHHGRGARLTGRLALAADGRFLSLSVKLDADLGAWVTPVGAHIHVHNPLQTLTGVYDIPAAAFEPSLWFTNAVPTGPYRGAGRPDIALLIEHLVDEAARATGIDPVALRRRNLVRKGSFPHVTAVGARYDSGDYASLLRNALAAGDWRGMPRRRRDARRQGLLHGVGMSLFTEVAGGGPVAADEVELSLHATPDGLAARLATVTGSTGQNHAEAFARIIERRLDIRLAAFELAAGEPGMSLEGAGSFASRTITAAGAALANACDQLRARAGARAGSGETLEAIVRAANDPEAFRAKGRAPVSVTFPAGCHVAEVEVDPETGIVRLTRYVAVDDAGTVIDADAVHGQIMGGVAQGVGGVLGEIARYDEDGQLVASTFMDYQMPRAGDLPSITVVEDGCPSPNNPLGAKGTGEAGTTGALGAVMNAVADALAQAGAPLPGLPLTPQTVFRALHERS